MAVNRKLRRQLNELIDRFTPDIRDAFLASVVDVTDTAALNAIIDAIRAGDVLRAFRATGMSPAAMRPLTRMVETAFETGGVTVARTFPVQMADAGASIIHFDVRNSRAEAWLRDHSSQLVTRITAETQQNIQTIVEAGMRAGRNPRSIALDIIGRVDDRGVRSGGIIGLTGQQTKWVANAREELTSVPPDENYFTRVQRDKRFDSTVRKAIKEGRGLTPDEVETLSRRYSDNLLQLRGETIARTEAQTALAKSQDEAIRQAIDNGTLRQQDVTKIWDATGDARTRPSHMHLDGQRVGMNEAFTTADGAQLMFPLDTSLGAPASETINCRCRVDYDVDWLAEVVDDPEIDWSEWGADNPPPPVPPVPQAQQFAYESYEPKKTRKELDAWARENIATEFYSMRTSNLDGLNEIARSVQEVNERFNMPKLPFLGDPAKATQYKFRNSARTVAAYAESIDYLIFKTLPTDAKALQDLKTPPDRARQFLRDAKVQAEISGAYNPQVIEGLRRMEEKLWAVSNTPASVMYHEMGHRLHGLNKAEINAVFPSDFKAQGWHHLVSKYASTNIEEYIAEAFSLYMQGEQEHWRIYPALLELFKRKDRKNVTSR